MKQYLLRAMIVSNVRCEKKDNGKWKCYLYKESIFEPLHPREIKAITIKTSEGTMEREPAEAYKMKSRKYEIIDDIDRVDIYNPWAVTLLSPPYQGEVEIEPSNKRIMHCRVYHDKHKKILYCSCKEAILIKGKKS